MSVYLCEENSIGAYLRNVMRIGNELDNKMVCLKNLSALVRFYKINTCDGCTYQIPILLSIVYELCAKCN